MWGYLEYHGVFSTMEDIMSTMGVILSTVGGHHDAHGGYHKYRGGAKYRGGKNLLLFEYSTVLNTPQYS